MQTVRLPNRVYKTFDTLETQYPKLRYNLISNGNLTSQVNNILNAGRQIGATQYNQFVNQNGRFDVDAFNKVFQESTFQTYNTIEKEEQAKLGKLNTSTPVIPKIHQMTIGQIFSKMFEAFYNLITFNFQEIDTLYLFLLILFISLFIAFIIYIAKPNLSLSESSDT